MDINYKGCLQEYCQNRRLPSPIYRLVKQSGPQHSLRFQAEVEIDGKLFLGEDLCFTKKKAEQSAANRAYNVLISTNRNSVSIRSIPQHSAVQSLQLYSKPLPSSSSSYSSLLSYKSMKHMPCQYADIEQFIVTKVGPFGGRIRKIWAPDEQGRYKFEITGTYRYCENVDRHHRKNHIYFVVDPIEKTYYQKCHDSECSGFQSDIETLPTNNRNAQVKRRIISSTNDLMFVKHLRQITE